MISSIVNSKPSRLFILLGCFFVANALIAEFIGVKIFSLEATLNVNPAQLKLFGVDFSFDLTAGVLLWPIVFVMTDIINEYYGQKGVKFLSYLTAVLISYAFFMFYFGINLAPANWWTTSKEVAGVPNMQHAYEAVFGQGLWIIIGSLIAFLVGQVLDVFIFHKIKKVTGESKIWLRATGSTVVSQFIDSFVVLGVAFYIGPMLQPSQGTPWSLQQLASVGTGNYIYKFLVALLMTPVIYLIHNLIDKYLGEHAEVLKKAAMERG